MFNNMFKNMFKNMFGPKSVDIKPGESREIGFGVEWVKNKREVRMFFGAGKDDVLILNEEIIKKRGFPVLTVSASNADPISIELIPDFDKHEINTREIKDVNVVKKFTDDDAKLEFVGLEKIKIGKHENDN